MSLALIITYAAMLFLFGTVIAIFISAVRLTRNDPPAPKEVGGAGSTIAGWIKGVLVFFLLGFLKAILRNTPWFYQFGAIGLTALICLGFYLRSIRQPMVSIKLN